MKKLVRLLSVFVVAGAMATAIAGSGCGHRHTYEDKWSSDGEKHWHQATCEHSDMRGDEGEHEFGDDNICDVCGYDKEVHVQSVSLNKSETTIKVGESETLRATVKPENATNKNRTWSSDNEEVATVSNNVVTAHKAGTATITVTTADGNKTATCKVTVTEGDVHVTGIELDETEVTLKIKGTETLHATVMPENATNKNRVWTSSNPLVVSVDNGSNVITAHQAGTATITVTTVDGGHSAECKVTVLDEEAEQVAVTGVTLDHTEATIKVGGTFTLRATVMPENATNKNRT